MTAKAHEISLRLEIKNRQPLELQELSKSLAALSAQYDNYAISNGYTEEERSAKLVVKEIKSGSVIMDLIELGSRGVIPFAEHVNTIAGFAEYVSKAVNYFVKGEGDKPELSIQDCKDLSQIVSPIAKDDGAQFNMSVKVDGDLHQHVYLNTTESKMFQQQLKSEVKTQLEPKNGDVFEHVFMVFYQTRNKIDGKGGNKVTIDDIVEGKPLNVIFSDKKVKKQILKGADNPNNFVFEVDVQVKTVHGEVKGCDVIKYHDKFPLEEE